MTNIRLWSVFSPLLLLLPLARGGQSPLAWSITGLLIATLVLGHAIVSYRSSSEPVWRPLLWPPAILFSLVVAWMLVQLLPLAANPLWEIASKTLGTSLKPSISVAPEATLAALIRLLSFSGCFWLALQFGRDPERAYALLRWFSYASAIYAFYGLVNYLAGNHYLLWSARIAYGEDVTGTFVNRNSYATYAGMGLLTATALFLSGFQRAWRRADPTLRLVSRAVEAMRGQPMIHATSSILIAMALMQSHSRMGFVSTIAGLLALILVGRTLRTIRSRLITLSCSFIVALGLLSSSGEGLLSRLAGTETVDRLPIFTVALRAIDTAPLQGSGYGTFAAIFPMFRDSSVPDDKAYIFAHDTYIELATEIGMPATVLLLLALIWLAALVLIGAYTRKRDNIIPSLAFAAATLVAIHATLDFSVQIPAVGCMFAALLGLGNAQAWTSNWGMRRSSFNAEPDSAAGRLQPE